jgi:putative aldouronate transport system substrate-binding protein
MKKTRFLAAAMLIGAAALILGCNRPAPAASSGGASGGSRTGWFAGRDFNEHFTIERADIQMDNPRDYNTDAFGKIWTGDFNITWDLTSISWADWHERIRVWVNSGDAPDWFTYSYEHGEAVTWADQGLVKELPADWKTRYPNLARAQANVPIAEQSEKDMGGTFFLFRPAYANNRPSRKLSDHMSFYIRKDWAQTVGVPIKDAYTLSEVIDYARKVKAADPGKVGSGFAPIHIDNGGLGLFLYANNAYSGYYTPYYKGKDGKYHWGPGDEATLQGLKILNQAYREGLITKEFYTVQSSGDIYGEFYTTGRAAGIWYGGMSVGMTDMQQYLKNDLGLEYDDVVHNFPVLGEDGYFHGIQYANYWGAIAFSPNMSDKKLDRILQMLDYSCTDEGQYRIRLGVQGVDWDFDANGQAYSMLDPEVNLWDKYAMLPIYVNMLVLSDDYQFTDPNYVPRFRDRAKQLYQIREDYSTDETFPPDIDWNVSLHSSRAVNLALMEYSEEYAALVVKAGDIEANWRAWVNEKMPLIQPVLDELNAKQ